jgi:hypothetical protein
VRASSTIGELNFLLLASDERRLRRYLTDDLRLRPVAHHPEDSSDLPSQTQPREGTWEFVFWADFVGPIVRLGETPRSSVAKERVAERLDQEALGEDWSAAIDPARTPLIRFRRSNWNRNEHLNPGLLQASASPRAEQPRALLALHRRIQGWLMSEGDRLNPFDYCKASPIEPPHNLTPFWVWGRPDALAWVHEGGLVWPWSA